MNVKHQEKERSITLSCSHGGQCPVVTLAETEVKISDDFGGIVRLTHEQFKKLQKVR